MALTNAINQFSKAKKAFETVNNNPTIEKFNEVKKSIDNAEEALLLASVRNTNYPPNIAKEISEIHEWVNKSPDELKYVDNNIALFARCVQLDLVPETRFDLFKAAKTVVCAQFYVGELFKKEMKFDKAIANYLLAANQGLPEAQLNLGLLLKKTNIEEARAWIEKAAKCNYILAIRELERF